MRPLTWLVVLQSGCLLLGLTIQYQLLSHGGLESIRHALTHELPQMIWSGSFRGHSDVWLTVIGSFFWTGGLQAAIAYLLFMRVLGDVATTQKTSEQGIRRKEQDLVRTRNAVVFGLAKLAESRDPETGQHLERIAHYSTRLSEALRRHVRYREQITPGFVKLIGISSALHDIGKVAIEDAVLLKPGQLTPEERVQMQTHAAVGGDCLREIEMRLGDSNFLQMAREIAMSHHERWDGSGYPYGLRGEEIPLAARIVALADVYDALSVRRVYKNALPHAECVSIIRREAGRQFDPHIVDIFLSIEHEFREIATQLNDAEGRLKTESLSTEGLSPEQADLVRRVLADVSGSHVEVA